MIGAQVVAYAIDSTSFSNPAATEPAPEHEVLDAMHAVASSTRALPPST